MDATLTGTVAVVTGGARGIGLELARALATDGADIALLDLLDTVDDAAKALADEFGVRTMSVALDVTDAEAVQAAFARVRDELGTPRTLVTAAGISIWNDTVDVSAAEWRKVMAVNLDGTFFAVQAFGKGLLDAGEPGSAILISSMSASIVNVPQFQASYNASKAAVAHLGRSLALEWAPQGIRVNAIAPGYVLSDMTKQLTEGQPALRDAWTARIPLGRMAEPADLTGLVRFLASDASAYMTGQDVIIDGGYTLA